MKKKLAYVLSLIMIFSLFTIIPVKASSQKMTVKVTDDQTLITVSNCGDDGKAQLYAYGANEYYTADQIRGISKDVKSTGTLIGEYDCGTNETFTRDRYDSDGRDTLYDKYYLVQDDEIIKGPIYATSISPENEDNIVFKQKSIKGLFNENSSDMTYAKDLGVSSITINFDLATIILAKQTTDSDDAISFDSNGKTYYFSKSGIAHYDQAVQAATSRKMNVIGIVLVSGDATDNQIDDQMRYDGNHSGTFMGTNTSNDTGRDDYIAAMEFLAQRYSQSKDQGLIQTYVIGNEVDFTPYFYNCGKLNTFMEEYSRALRLSNLAVKKYSSQIQVVAPFTHYWRGDVRKLGKENKGGALKPYDMINWLAKYTNARGAYDWGLAPHIYGVWNTSSQMAKKDVMSKGITGNYKTSDYVTFSNVEILQSYLSQSKLKYKGKLRSVYLTEAGMSSSTDTKKSRQHQAMSLAQGYYKVAHLSFIKAFNYYRLKDEPSEAKHDLRLGVIDLKGKKKLSYNVFKYVDTYKGSIYADQYLKYMAFKRNGKKSLKNFKSWKDTMTVYNSSFNWNKAWSMNKVIRSDLKAKAAGSVKSLRSSKTTRNSIKLTWGKSSKTSGYEVYVNGQKRKTTSSRSYTVKGLKHKTKYLIHVISYHKAGGKKYYGYSKNITVKTR